MPSPPDGPGFEPPPRSSGAGDRSTWAGFAASAPFAHAARPGLCARRAAVDPEGSDGAGLARRPGPGGMMSAGSTAARPATPGVVSAPPPGGGGLRLRDLAVALGGRPVLGGVSLHVAPGEVVALEGVSGAGKTTLIRACAGLVPHGGRAECGPTGRERPAVVFQHHALAGRLPARANVLVGALGRVGALRAALGVLLGAWPEPELRLAEGCLDRVGLAGLGGRRTATLSGGQRQRVAVARALAQRAPVLLADEPVASLDPGNAEAVLGLLRDLARDDGLAVLVCLHQPELARRFADRRLRLHGGALEPL